MEFVLQASGVVSALVVSASANALLIWPDATQPFQSLAEPLKVPSLPFPPVCVLSVNLQSLVMTSNTPPCYFPIIPPQAIGPTALTASSLTADNDAAEAVIAVVGFQVWGAGLAHTLKLYI